MRKQIVDSKSFSISTKKQLFIFRFRPVIVKECIHNILNERLTGKRYDTEETIAWTKEISDEIKLRLRGK